MNLSNAYRRISPISFILVLILGHPALAAESNHFELHAVAGDKLMGQVQSLPVFKVYDTRGHQVFFEEGMSTLFRQRITETITSPPAGDARLTLAKELALLVQDDGSAVEVKALPQADFTFVKYWATWCAPCHKQLKTVKELIAAHPEVKINLIHVEADSTK